MEQGLRIRCKRTTIPQALRASSLYTREPLGCTTSLVCQVLISLASLDSFPKGEAKENLRLFEAEVFLIRF